MLSTLRRKPFENLGSFAFVTDGEHGNPKTFPTGFAKYYGARNTLEGILNENDVEYITQEHHHTLRKSALKPNDILISCVGANVGHACIVPDNVGEANIVRNVALMRSKSKLFSNHYLLAYFLCKYGKELYIRLKTGNAQPLVSLDYIKTIPVFTPSDNFQKAIIKLVEQAKERRNNAILLFDTAIDKLMTEIGFSNWKPTSENKVVKTFSRSFKLNGRLDAEYYQLYYKEIEDKIKSYKWGYELFGKCITLFDENFNPDDKTEYNYIELADIGTAGNISSSTFDFGNNLPSRARRLVKSKNVILSSIEGSLDKCAFITDDYSNSLCSTGFYVISSPNLLSEVLIVLFKSYPMQQLLKRGCSGTILTAISKDELIKIPVPKLREDFQSELMHDIQNSFSQRQLSNHLIHTARQAVEIVIEQDEQTAMKFIKENN